MICYVKWKPELLLPYHIALVARGSFRYSTQHGKHAFGSIVIEGQGVELNAILLQHQNCCASHLLWRRLTTVWQDGNPFLLAAGTSQQLSGQTQTVDNACMLKTYRTLIRQASLHEILVGAGGRLQGRNKVGVVSKWYESYVCGRAGSVDGTCCSLLNFHHTTSHAGWNIYSNNFTASLTFPDKLQAKRQENTCTCKQMYRRYSTQELLLNDIGYELTSYSSNQTGLSKITSMSHTECISTILVSAYSKFGRWQTGFW